MDFNFELILTLACLITLGFWVMARFVQRSREGVAANIGEYFPVLAVVLVLRSFVYEPFQIPSGSMIPTLKIGDFILVNKWTYGIRLPVLRTKVISVNSPERGDIMVFFPPNEDRYFIKRVVGVPGDKVQFIEGELFINGELVSRELVNETRDLEGKRVKVYSEQLGPVTHAIYQREQMADRSIAYIGVVPAEHYLMVGDNRDNSHDGRYFGFVPEERIVGKAVARWMHWDKFLSVPSFATVGAIY